MEEHGLSGLCSHSKGPAGTVLKAVMSVVTPEQIKQGVCHLCCFGQSYHLPFLTCKRKETGWVVVVGKQCQLWGMEALPPLGPDPGGISPTLHPQAGICSSERGGVPD